MCPKFVQTNQFFSQKTPKKLAHKLCNEVLKMLHKYSPLKLHELNP